MEVKYHSISDVSRITGLSKSSIYKLTAARMVSFYKPFGKRIFMTPAQIDEMMTRTRAKSREELFNETQNQGREK